MRQSSRVNRLSELEPAAGKLQVEPFCDLTECRELYRIQVPPGCAEPLICQKQVVWCAQDGFGCQEAWLAHSLLSVRRIFRQFHASLGCDRKQQAQVFTGRQETADFASN